MRSPLWIPACAGMTVNGATSIAHPTSVTPAYAGVQNRADFDLDAPLRPVSPYGHPPVVTCCVIAGHTAPEPA